MKQKKLILHFFMILGLTHFLNGCHISPDTYAKAQTTSETIEKKTSRPDHLPTGKHEQESCTVAISKTEFTQSDCENGLICTPDIYQKGAGTCRVPCDAKNLDQYNDEFKKGEGTCPLGRTCQLLTSLHFTSLGTFCLPQQHERNGLCQAAFDTKACSKGRTCLPSSISKSGKNLSTKNFVCRNTCPYNEPEANQACGAQETCLLSPDGKTGVCGKEVRWASIKDFSPQFSGKTCNENSSHQFCNRSLLAGLENAAEPTCFSVSDTKSQGICFAFCSVPALDIDADGQIGPSESQKTLACPAHHTCSPALGREIGLVKLIPDPQNPKKNKACEPALCKSNQPCQNNVGPETLNV